jgi:hypothetical protein
MVGLGPQLYRTRVQPPAIFDHQGEVVLAIYASAVFRRPIDLKDFNPPENLFDQLAQALKRQTTSA